MKGPVPWWKQDDLLFSAPWWLRYPACIGVFALAYWCAYEWENAKAGWLIGAMLVFNGLFLIRELSLAAVFAVIVGLALWAAGAAVAALPVSVAIIVGAMIIAQAVRR